MQHITPDPRSSTVDSGSLPDTVTSDLISYLEVLVSNWRIIAKVTFTAAMLSAIISISIPNIYTSTAKILPPQQDASGLMGLLMGSAGGMGGVAADLLGKGTPADMYVGILSSDAISDRIIDRFKLMEVYEQKYRISTYKVLDKHVNIMVGKKDGIISISVEDKDPKRAAEIANSYVDELSKLSANLSITGAGQNRAFYEERLSKAKVDLARTEDALKAFQNRYKALDISEQAKGTIKGVADLEAQLAMEEVKLAGFRQALTDGSQEVKSQRAIISNIKAQIAKFEGKRTGSSIPGVDSVPEMGQQYLRLMREFKIQETIVELLTKQHEMAKLSEAKDSASLQVIQSAREPDRKSKPKRALLVLVATSATFILTVMIVFMIHGFNSISAADKTRIQNMLSYFPLLRRMKLATIYRND